MLRSATDADRDAVLALARAEDIAWFGAPEYTAEEMSEFLDNTGGVAAGVVALTEGESIAGFAVVGGTKDCLLIVDPGLVDPPYAELLDWLRDRGTDALMVYAEDKQRLAALEKSGWQHTFSNFELARPGADPVEAPQWPDGVTVSGFDRDADAAEVHHLIYVRARWADVPGHRERPFEQWVGMLGADEGGWVARHNGRIVGVVIGRVFADGRGWIHQIAVDKAERGAGIGRALLLQAYTALLAAGATSLGLDVQAHNENALGLYRSVGLDIKREWRLYAP